MTRLGEYVRRPLVRYLLVRVAWLVGLMLVISLGTYALLEIAPGSLERTLLGNKNPDPAAVAAVRAQYHLDDPFLQRYWTWLTGAIHGDLGTSIRTQQSVASALGSRFVVSVELAVMALAFVVFVGGPLGILAALRRGGTLDRSVVSASVIGLSAPPFAIGIALLYIFAVALPWLPAFGTGTGVGDRAVHLILPALALALTSMAVMVKVTRAAFIRELEQDYVVAARARGLSSRYVLWHYVARNAMLPVTTVTGLLLGALIGGAVLVEVAFSISGVGSLLIESVNFKDLPVVQGVALVIALTVILLNTLVDLLYAVIDPRVRIGARGA